MLLPPLSFGHDSVSTLRYTVTSPFAASWLFMVILVLCLGYATPPYDLRPLPSTAWRHLHHVRTLEPRLSLVPYGHTFKGVCPWLLSWWHSH